MKDAPIDGSGLKQATLRWLESLKAGEGRYRITNCGGASLFTSCAAVFIRDLLGDLPSLSAAEKNAWVAYLQGFQDPATGYFCDTPEIGGALSSAYWESSYVREEATYFCVMALSALGARPRYRLTFLDALKEPSALVSYFKALDWREPWYQSNKVMFRLSLLIDDSEAAGAPSSNALAHAALDWLDSWQDPRTGVWGTNRGGSLYQGVFTAFHFVYFYFYLNRKLNHMPALIDSTLSLQNKYDGLFSPHGGGGACQDLDAVDILVKCGMADGHREEDVRKALQRTFYGILQNRNDDYGFCWARVFPFTPLQWLRSLPALVNTTSRSRGILPEFVTMVKTHRLPKGYAIRYSGLDYLSYFSAESNIFSTWFRLLTLALIDSRYPGTYTCGIEWHFPKKAGLGWHRPAAAGRAAAQP